MALDTILLLYDGQDDADAMLDFACSMVGSRGQIIPLYVTVIPGTLPLAPLPSRFDRHGHAVLDRAEARAWRRGVALNSWLIRAWEPIEAIAEVARICEVRAIIVPQCSWMHPWRYLRTLQIVRELSRAVSCPILAGSWQLPAEGAGQVLSDDVMEPESA